jgi:hypothetical protein
MASRYYALDLGENMTQVAEGSSTQSKTVEIAIDLADSANRQQVFEAIENIRNYILQDIWPPA